jgi:hypothetical protein
MFEGLPRSDGVAMNNLIGATAPFPKDHTEKIHVWGPALFRRGCNEQSHRRNHTKIHILRTCPPRLGPALCVDEVELSDDGSGGAK